MKTINNQYQEPLLSSKILNSYFEDLAVAIIDIETTGLHPEKNQMILGGISVPNFKNSTIETIQYFAEHIEEEPAVLQAYSKILGNFDLVISYNGNQFDLPFFRKRLKATHLPDINFSPCQSLDLYWALNAHTNLRRVLPNLKQKTVESFMGLWATRADEITGRESVQLYESYLQTGDQESEDLILLHNCDDLLQLTRLLGISEKIDVHKIMFYNGFPVSEGGKIGYIERIKPGKYYTELLGTLKDVSMDYKWFEENYQIQIVASSGAFTIKLSDLPQSRLLDSDGNIDYGHANKEIKLIFKEILSKL